MKLKDILTEAYVEWVAGWYNPDKNKSVICPEGHQMGALKYAPQFGTLNDPEIATAYDKFRQSNFNPMRFAKQDMWNVSLSIYQTMYNVGWIRFVREEDSSISITGPSNLLKDSRNFVFTKLVDKDTTKLYIDVVDGINGFDGAEFRLPAERINAIRWFNS